ncbi:hypothetical protein AAG906_001229 [Vitis piasezkii]|uniref:Uncharacterized protein n=2 Tax=Vitis vinifera TaxID=29760 RepID=A0A438EYI6_VITVI|eukprot:XP_002283493.1 PREDICTED: uncharacterized protein LOC100265593 [Vitis vinifera]
MGNCQAIDAATLVIQYPCGKADKLYWPVSASEVMKMNPGHYVALLITTTLCPTTATTTTAPSSVRITRVKLLRPTDTLVLGQVYRLITAEEVMKALWAKKYAKMKKTQAASADMAGRVNEKLGGGLEFTVRRSEMEKNHQMARHERGHERGRGRTAAASAGANSATARPRTWQPSLHSILEGGS